MVSSNDVEDGDDDAAAAAKQPGAGGGKLPVGMLVQLAAAAAANQQQQPAAAAAAGQALLLGDVGDVQQLFQFPSLRTMSRVSWCFLKYTKPNSGPAAPRGSVYGSWSVNTYNPNPLNLSTKAALALLRSKQRRNADLLFTTAAMSPPSSGKLVSSVAWKLRFDQVGADVVRPFKCFVSFCFYVVSQLDVFGNALY